MTHILFSMFLISLAHACTNSGWSSWINDRIASSTPLPGEENVKDKIIPGGDKEDMNATARDRFCPSEHGVITKIQCVTVGNETNYTHAQTGAHAYFCEVANGFTCYNRFVHGNVCFDYKIRLFCDCKRPSQSANNILTDRTTMTSLPPQQTTCFHERFIPTSKQATTGQTTAAPKICWDTKWYNTSAPTATNRSDYESQPAKVLDSICISGSVIAARCRDEKGEPFQAFKNDTVNQYFATCDAVRGLICNPYNNTMKMCADFEIQYGCSCPTTTPPYRKTTETTVIGGSSPSGGSSIRVTEASVRQHGQGGNGVQKCGVGHFAMVLCVFLKLFG